MAKVLFFTDVHFGIHSNSQRYVDICTDTMEWIGKTCKERNIGEVVFGGDFFDSRSSIDVRLMSVATQSLYGLANGGLKIRLVVGNHDIYLRDATNVNSLVAYGANGNVEIVDKPTWLCDGTVLLLPWGYGTSDNAVALNGREKTVFCHHNFPKDFFIGGGKSKKSDTDVSDEFSEFGFQKNLVETVIANGGNIFSGHIHHPSEIPLADKSSIVIAGSPYETEFGFKNVPCGTFVVDTDTSGYEFVENPHSRKHVEVRTSSIDEDLDSKPIKSSFVRLVVDTQESFEAISDMQRKIGSLDPYYVLPTVFEFKSAAFVGGRDEDANPLESVNGSAMSKADYVNRAIDGADFSSFTYDDGGKAVEVSKDELKSIADGLFEKGNAK